MEEKLYTKAVLTRSSKQDTDFIAVASTAVEDRHGEIVSVDGWETKNFKDNPILLWAHNHSEIGVGQAKKFWIEGTGKKAKFMIEGFIHEATDTARALKYLVKEGIIRTMSVGFKPIDMDGSTYTKQELLEVSFVNVPANPQAQISAIKGLRSAGFKDKTITELGIPVAIIDKIEDLEKQVNELQTAVKAYSREIPSVNPHGRRRIQIERASMHKVIARAADKLLQAEKQNAPVDRVPLLRAVKRANELLVVSQRKQFNGENKRTP